MGKDTDNLICPLFALLGPKGISVNCAGENCAWWVKRFDLANEGGELDREGCCAVVMKASRTSGIPSFIEGILN